LIDFGTARTITSSAIGFSTKAGTPAYQAPEVIVPQEAVPMNFKADIWSLGCILHFICNKEHAFQAADEKKLSALIN
jgi:serine/threonine protein kinase